MFSVLIKADHHYKLKKKKKKKNERERKVNRSHLAEMLLNNINNIANFA